MDGSVKCMSEFFKFSLYFDREQASRCKNDIQAKKAKETRQDGSKHKAFPRVV